MNHHELLSMYNSTSEMFPSSIETKVRNISYDKLALEYSKEKNCGYLYECSKLAVYGTDYKVNQFVLLPQSTNRFPLFGRIKKLLCDEKNGYLIVNSTFCQYCAKSDLFIIDEKNGQELLVPVQHLADFHPLEGSALFLS